MTKGNGTSMVRNITILSVAVFSVILLSAGQTAFADDSGFVSIFDGKTLKGWDGDLSLWSVKDGAIHGETTAEKRAKGNTFIIWKGGTLKDFELKLSFRIEGSNNSGVQYRSKLVSKPTDENRWVVSGYQAEVTNSLGQVGFLYHEKGRGGLVRVGDLVVIDETGQKNIISNVSDVEELKKAGYCRPREWNDYHIIARGNHLIHYLNGYKTMELIDNDRLTDPEDPADRKGAAREGLLALQIHAGSPMTIEFKDIRVKHLEEGKYGDAQLIFNGKDLNNWNAKEKSGKANKWVVGKAKVSSSNPKQLENAGGSGEMINLTPSHGQSRDFYSDEKFADCLVEVQVMVPQGSNSGVYVMGEYEVQVLDSWGKPDNKMGSGDMGAIYGGHKPERNASKKPGEWQQYVIEWQAPRFDASGNKKEKAVFRKVELNGKRLHENKTPLIMEKNTPGGVTLREWPEGPLMFQGNHGPVAYRNIIVTPLKK